MSISFTIPSWYILFPLSVLLFAIAAARTFIAKRFSFRQFSMLAVFIVYAVGVLHFVLFPIHVNLGAYANQTPWQRTIQWIPLLTMDAKTFLLNVVLFVPLGIGLPLLRASCGSIRQAAYAAFWVSLFFELTQLAFRIVVGTGRMTDINDLIANSLGGALGFIFYRKLVAVKRFDRLLNGFRLRSQ